MRTEAISVFWKDKFNGKAATIDKADFDSALHRLAIDGPWPAKGKAEPEADSDEIPADFPGAAQLTAAGYATLAELRDLTAEDLVQIKGIGNAKAEAILAALEE